MAVKDRALADVRQRLASSWGPLESETTAEDGSVVWAQAATLADSGDWALDVTAWQSADVSPIAVSTWAERGRDGVDLPVAGLVAQRAAFAPERLTSCFTVEGGVPAAGAGDGGISPPFAWLRIAPVLWETDPAAAYGTLAIPWSLDEGWRLLLAGMVVDGTAAAGVAPGDGVWVLSGRQGEWHDVPAEWGVSAAAPGLVVVIGGASLDAAGLGERWGVIVADEADVRLDGTNLHGGVLATGTVDFGATGTVSFSRAVVRWATDRCLTRVRLVPGSRREVID
jgi:hypothetical protein